MKIYLVRHARTEPRSDGPREALLRPLSDAGFEQADALAEYLSGERLARIVSAPELRCQETVAPLAIEHRMSVQVDERLGTGEGVARALELLATVERRPVLFCTHAAMIVSLLEELELVEPAGRPDCRKGSLWVLESRDEGPLSGTYVEPTRRDRRAPGALAPALDRPRTTRAACLDLGSTSFTLLIADVTADGDIQTVVREKVMLRLGASLAENASIPNEVCDLAVACAQELWEVARREKVERFFAVATAALREAENGARLTGRIESATGEPVRTLSGEEEARVMFRAFQRRLHLGDEPVLGIDLGGGSLELAMGRANRIERERSLRVGVVRLNGELVASDPMTRAEAGAVRERVLSELDGWKSSPEVPVHAIAAGGTARGLARLVEPARSSPRSPDGRAVEIPAETLSDLTDALVRSSQEERLRMRGIRKERADLLPTGALIFTTLVEELGLDGLTVCDWGLREGFLLEELGHTV